MPFIFAALMLVFLSSLIARGSSVAVIPYRASGDISGDDYAKIVTLAAHLHTSLHVARPADVRRDLERFGINPKEALTPADLALYGRSRNLDYIITGDLQKRDRGYHVRSRLFSVKDDRIIESGGNDGKRPADLALRELEYLFPGSVVPGETAARENCSSDLLILFDGSYRMAPWKADINRALTAHLSSASGGCDTRIYLMPLSDRQPVRTSIQMVRTPDELSREMARLRPSGTLNTVQLDEAFRYTLSSLRLRSSAEKKAVLLLSSPLEGTGTLDRYAHMFRQRGISIESVVIAGNSETFDVASRLARITRGEYHRVSWRQKLYDTDGRPFYLYQQDGVMYRGISSRVPWQQGLGVGRSVSAGLRPVPGSRETLRVDPRKMAAQYKRVVPDGFVRAETPEHNLSHILAKGTPAGVSSIVARVLLSDGRVSLWSDVSDEAALHRFEESMRQKRWTYCGAHRYVASRTPYGYGLDVRHASLPFDMVPDSIVSSFSEAQRGTSDKTIGSPPLWIFRVKVLQIRQTASTGDVRE